VFNHVCCQATDVAVVMRRRSKSSAYIMAPISRESSLPSLVSRLSTSPFHPITPMKYSLGSINALVRSRTHEPMEADVSILTEAELSSLPGYPYIPSKLMVGEDCYGPSLPSPEFATLKSQRKDLKCQCIGSSRESLRSSQSVGPCQAQPPHPLISAKKRLLGF
jgi:hypothetical protein